MEPIHILISIAWIMALLVATVPTLGRWIFVRVLQVDMEIRNFIECNSFR